MTLTYNLNIDWTGAGSTDNEADYMKSFKIDRGRDYIIKTDNSGLQEVSPGRAVFTLENVDGRYDFFTTDSPLYPNVFPGKVLTFDVEADWDYASLYSTTDVIAAWIPKGAADYVTARTDLTGNGYDLTTDNFNGTWSAENGFEATTDAGYFDTGVSASQHMTIYAAFDGVTGDNQSLFGVTYLASPRLAISVTRNIGDEVYYTSYYHNEFSLVSAGNVSSGVIAVNKDGLIFNGIRYSGFSANTPSTAETLALMANNSPASLSVTGQMTAGNLAACIIVAGTDSEEEVKRKTQLLQILLNDNRQRLFTGKIEDIRDTPSRNQNLVTIYAVDKLSEYATTREVAVGVKEDITLKQAFEYAIEAAGDTDYHVDGMLDPVPFYFSRRKKATTAISELVSASYGRFFVDAYNKPTYYGWWRSNDTPVQLTQSHIGDEISIAQPWNHIRNNVTVAINTFTAGAESLLWSLPERYPLESGGNYIMATHEVSYDIVNPQGTTDIYITDALSGADMTTDFVVNLSTAADKTTINIEGAPDVIFAAISPVAYLETFNLRGKSIELDTEWEINNSSTDSIDNYGDRKLNINSPNIQRQAVATELSRVVLDLFDHPNKVPSITIEDRPDKQFMLDLFGFVDLSVDYLSINGNYRVGKLIHESIGENCQQVRTTLKLEPTQLYSADVWTFPTVLGISSIFST